MPLLKASGVDVVSIYVKDASIDSLGYLDSFFSKLTQYGIFAFPRVQNMATLDDAKLIFQKFIKSPAQWYSDGKPVFSWFTFPSNITPDDLRSFKSSLKPSPLFWRVFIGIKSNPQWRGILDGSYGWVGLSPTSVYNCPSVSSLYKEQCTFDQEVAGWPSDVINGASGLQSGDFNEYVIGVSPGFDDILVNGWNLCGTEVLCTHQIDRADGKTYQFKWQAAIHSNYRYAAIDTFDDWGEGSLIHPTIEFGNQYLDLTRNFTAQFKDIKPNTLNLSIPEWIYKIRKSNPTVDELAILIRAYDAIANEQYDSAEQQVLPLAKKYKLN